MYKAIKFQTLINFLYINQPSAYNHSKTHEFFYISRSNRSHDDSQDS